MANQVEAELQKIEKAMNKLRNKLKRADLDYTVQITVNSISPTNVVYAAQMTALANGLRPATFISHISMEDLVAQIKAFTKDLNQAKLEKAYHEGQILSAKNTILGHEEAISELDNPKKENDSDDEEIKEKGEK